MSAKSKTPPIKTMTSVLHSEDAVFEDDGTIIFLGGWSSSRSA